MDNSISQKKTAKPYKKRQKRNLSEVVRNIIVMNHNGDFFSGFERGHFKWSPKLGDAKPLDSIDQYDFIKTHEPFMEVIYEYT